MASLVLRIDLEIDDAIFLVNKVIKKAGQENKVEVNFGPLSENGYKITIRADLPCLEILEKEFDQEGETGVIHG